jgi:TolB-like protein/DNA-binding winged helix-turn-helix (wHTH) protein/Flp pilus assembly protein TadD
MDGSVSNVPKVLSFGPFTVDLRLGELRKQGTRIRLQEQPLRVLAVLLERPGDLVTRDELRQRRWPADTFVDFDHGLNAAINRLREPLGDSAEQPRYIETIPRRGYRFVAPVEVIGSEEPAPPLAADRPPAAGPPAPNRRLHLALAGSLLALLTAGMWWAVRIRPRTDGAIPSIQSVAVLPLVNDSGDRAQDYFADGMTEALTTELSKIKALKVISRTSAMRYHHTLKSVPEIARDLHVDAVIEGSVMREGDQVRITVQLIDGTTDRHLWSERFQREARHVLALQADVARAIAGRFSVTVTPAERARLTTERTVDPRAYDAYLTGRYYWNRWDRALDKAIPAFQRATELDPTYAPAYANLALCYSTLGFMQRPNDVFPKAKAAVLKALELDPDLAEAHAAAGDISLSYDWDLPSGEREWRRAVELNPNSVEAHRLAAYSLITAGRLDEAIAEQKRAVELDPRSPNPVGELGWMFMNAHRYDESLSQYKRALELEPNHQMAANQIAWIYTLTGKDPEAYAEYTKLHIQCCDPWLGYLYAVTGRRKDALKVLDNLQRSAAKAYVDPYVIAIVYTGLGDRDKAFESLEKAYSERSTFLNHLQVENFFDPLRSDPRFADLSRRIGLPEVHFGESDRRVAR